MAFIIMLISSLGNNPSIESELSERVVNSYPSFKKLWLPETLNQGNCSLILTSKSSALATLFQEKTRPVSSESTQINSGVSGTGYASTQIESLKLHP